MLKQRKKETLETFFKQVDRVGLNILLCEILFKMKALYSQYTSTPCPEK